MVVRTWLDVLLMCLCVALPLRVSSWVPVAEVCCPLWSRKTDSATLIAVHPTAKRDGLSRHELAVLRRILHLSPQPPLSFARLPAKKTDRNLLARICGSARSQLAKENKPRKWARRQPGLRSDEETHLRLPAMLHARHCFSHFQAFLKYSKMQLDCRHDCHDMT